MARIRNPVLPPALAGRARFVGRKVVTQAAISADARPLGQDVLDVRARRLRGDRQLPGDLGVGQAVGDEASHLEFAARQRSPRLVERAAAAGGPCQLFGPCQQRRAPESLRHLAGDGQHAGRLAHPVRAEQATGQVEPCPRRFPDPAAVVPTVDGGFEHLAGHAGRAGSQLREPLDVVDGRSQVRRPAPDLGDDRLGPAVGGVGTTGPEEGPHPGHREGSEQGLFADRGRALERVGTSFRGRDRVPAVQLRLGQSPQRRQDQVDRAAVLAARQRVPEHPRAWSYSPRPNAT